MKSLKSHLIIWDYKDLVPSEISNKEVILWNQYSQNSYISIQDLIEGNSDTLKKEYLDWIYKIGNLKIRGQTLIEFLQIRKDLSAWWLGLIVEKSNFAKSLHINNIIKLMAFSIWFRGKSFTQITLYTNNKNLNNSFFKFCKDKNINYEYKKIKNFLSTKSFPSLHQIFQFIPNPLKGLIWFLYKIVNNIPLINVGKKQWKSIKKDFIFVSYLFNMSNNDKDNFFYSSYWGNLPEKLIINNKSSAWLHIFVKDDFINNPIKAAKYINNLNSKSNKFQSHVSLFSFLNFKVIKKVFLDWLNLFFKIYNLKIKKIIPLLSGFDVWDFYKKEWIDSFIGVSSIENLFMLSLFEEAFSLSNKPKSLTYLQENQGWESGMLSACKTNYFSKVIGFAHATMRFWDLRYFYDKREFILESKLSLPRPHFLALNSKSALTLLEKNGYPKSELRLVEALRHLYLRKIINSSFIKQKNNPNNLSTCKILILGDYLPENTIHQIKLFNGLSDFIFSKVKIIFKPHPACNLDIKKFNRKFNVTKEPISSLLSKVNIAFCSATTSAAVDAYSYGLQVIIASDPASLNLSPLRGYKDVFFVQNPKELEIGRAHV